MDVKAFIFEATDKALKIDEALNGVELAREAVEAARAAVETAKAGVDTAKAAVSAAKEELDTYAERAEEFGLTKSKFKDAVERMKALLTEIGAVETSGDTETQQETRPRATRKRKAQETAEAPAQSQVQVEATETENEPVAETQPLPTEQEVHPSDPDVLMIGEVTDTASSDPVEEAAEFGEVGEAHQVEAVEPLESGDEMSVEQLEALVETNEDELDNSFAEQELLDYVDELGSTDKAVHAALSAAIRVFSWYTTNVSRQPLRTSPSPLSLAGVLAAEGIDYLPAPIRLDFETATSHGTDKLAAAISWYNKGIELLADAKDVSDFRFADDAKPARNRTVNEEPETPATETEVAAEEFESMDVVIGDIPPDAPEIASIDDVDVFAGNTAASEEPAVEDTKSEPVADERKAPPFVKPTKPAWL